MGVERVVRFPAGGVPGWAEIAARLTAAGERPAFRMIDGLPAFPDEVPDPGWRELRVGLSGGMVTLHREPDAIRCVTWGTADPALMASFDLCCRAIGGGGDTGSGG